MERKNRRQNTAGINTILAVQIEWFYHADLKTREINICNTYKLIANYQYQVHEWIEGVFKKPLTIFAKTLHPRRLIGFWIRIRIRIYGSRFSRMNKVKFFISCLAKILLCPFLNTLTDMNASCLFIRSFSGYLGEKGEIIIMSD